MISTIRWNRTSRTITVLVMLAITLCGTSVSAESPRVEGAFLQLNETNSKTVVAEVVWPDREANA